MKTYVYTKTCPQMFIEGLLLMIAKKEKQLECPSAKEQIKQNVVYP